jgi:hypothetical protein
MRTSDAVALRHSAYGPQRMERPRRFAHIGHQWPCRSRRCLSHNATSCGHRRLAARAGTSADRTRLARGGFSVPHVQPSARAGKASLARLRSSRTPVRRNTERIVHVSPMPGIGWVAQDSRDALERMLLTVDLADAREWAAAGPAIASASSNKGSNLGTGACTAQGRVQKISMVGSRACEMPAGRLLLPPCLRRSQKGALRRPSCPSRKPPETEN